MLSIKKPTILDKKQIKDIYDKIKEGTISCPYTITSDILSSETKVYGDDKLLYVYDTLTLLPLYYYHILIKLPLCSPHALECF